MRSSLTRSGSPPPRGRTSSSCSSGARPRSCASTGPRSGRGSASGSSSRAPACGGSRPRSWAASVPRAAAGRRSGPGSGRRGATGSRATARAAPGLTALPSTRNACRPERRPGHLDRHPRGRATARERRGPERGRAPADVPERPEMGVRHELGAARARGDLHGRPRRSPRTARLRRGRDRDGLHRARPRLPRAGLLDGADPARGPRARPPPLRVLAQHRLVHRPGGLHGRAERLVGRGERCAGAPRRALSAVPRARHRGAQHRPAGLPPAARGVQEARHPDERRRPHRGRPRRRPGARRSRRLVARRAAARRGPHRPRPDLDPEPLETPPAVLPPARARPDRLLGQRLPGESRRLRQPALLVLAACSDFLLAVVGPEWAAGADALKFLAVAAIGKAVISFTGPLLFAVGRPAFRAVMLWLLGAASAGTVVAVASLLESASDERQIFGVALSRALLFVLVFVPVNLVIIDRLTGFRPRAFAAIAAAPTVAGAAAIAVVVALREATAVETIPPIAGLAIAGVLAGGTAAGLLLLLDARFREYARRLRRALVSTYRPSAPSPPGR